MITASFRTTATTARLAAIRTPLSRAKREGENRIPCQTLVFCVMIKLHCPNLRNVAAALGR
jgi:hypothetical protein